MLDRLTMARWSLYVLGALGAVLVGAVGSTQLGLVPGIPSAFMAYFSVENLSGEPISVVPFGTSSSGFARLRLSTDESVFSKGVSTLILEPGQKQTLRYPFDGENFCWLIVSSSAGARKMVPSGLSGGQCALDLPPDRERPCCWKVPTYSNFAIPPLSMMLADAPQALQDAVFGP